MGVTFYLMATGAHPWQDDEESAIRDGEHLESYYIFDGFELDPEREL